ncbi:tyrosine-type recombinase/integrase [Silvania hatchlandensis]|uniref:Site-specific integrase n=1 Tax=Silvania hatchlandensis TaxID=2926469 RepID=A0A9J6Q5D7_9ENTR|nr:site-specific integrase [Silvania hatchlandensis]MCU6666297.1 site-specific integrase [Silvania hatchlandensis]
MDFPTGVELHSGKIRITFTYRGVRCREVLRGWLATSGNIKKAGNLRAVIVSEIQLGTFDYASRFPESKALKKFSSTKRVTTFKELCDVFMEAKALEVSVASMQTNSGIINTLRRIIGDNTRLVDIQHSDLLNYRKELLTGDVVNSAMPHLNKKGRTPSTVNTRMSLLGEMLKLANRSQFIKHAPYEGVSLLKVSKSPPDPLLLHEYRDFMSALPEKQQLLWKLAIHSGMRHGELSSLAWEDVDLNKGEIHISRNITNKGLFMPPKTDAGIRTITLLQPAVEALRELYKISGNLKKTEICYHHRELGKTEVQHLRFVFVPGPQSKTKAGYLSKSAIAESWKSGMAKAEIRYRVPYQSRHTFACWTLSAGANPSFIASQMGHEDARMVYEVYSKWIGEMNANQVGMLNNTLPTATPPACPKSKTRLRKVV